MKTRSQEAQNLHQLTRVQTREKIKHSDKLQPHEQGHVQGTGNLCIALLIFFRRHAEDNTSFTMLQLNLQQSEKRRVSIANAGRRKHDKKGKRGSANMLKIAHSVF